MSNDVADVVYAHVEIVWFISAYRVVLRDFLSASWGEATATTGRGSLANPDASTLASL